ncbi:hypothetical protein [Chitinophaga sp. CF118]|nr:hypothetical protein [Chitinophaga sp. CF118]
MKKMIAVLATLAAIHIAHIAVQQNHTFPVTQKKYVNIFCSNN